MSSSINLERFRTEYPRAVQDVTRFVTPERQEVIARHNPGLERSRTSLSTYLKASENRYARALGMFAKYLPAGAELRALDVGGFLGAYPLTLARIGVQVTLAEVFAYYGGSLDELGGFLASEGVEVLDVDFTQPLAGAVMRKFTMVSNMAMLEHLADSPKQLMTNLRAVTSETGALLVEVPNIAYWPKRLSLLFGRTVHPPLDVVFGSATPFTGHHREYTVAEVTDLLRWTGFRPVAVDQFNFSFSFSGMKWVDRVNPATVRLLPSVLQELHRTDHGSGYPRRHVGLSTRLRFWGCCGATMQEDRA